MEEIAVKTMGVAVVGASALILATAGPAGAQNSASDQSEPAPMESAQGTVEDNAPDSQPLFTIGGVGVHVWAPVESPYDSRANGSLAGGPMWEGGTQPSQSGY
jgi:hypothetical protein